MTPTDKKTLGTIAKTIATTTLEEINALTNIVNTPSMPYKTQYVLEEVIRILKERV